MNIQEGLLKLWESTGIMTILKEPDPNITNCVEQFLHVHGAWIMILVCLFLLLKMFIYMHLILLYGYLQ